MADEKNDKKEGANAAGMAAAAIALTAIAGAAGAILANKDLRKNLGKKTVQALDVVSKIASKAEEGAISGLKNLRKDDSKTKKPPKKIKIKRKV